MALDYPYTCSVSYEYDPSGDDEISRDVEDWCWSRLGSEGWTIRSWIVSMGMTHAVVNYIVAFESREDAILFRLAWTGVDSIDNGC